MCALTCAAEVSLYHAASKSDGNMKSPTDSMFLHVEGIPHNQVELTGNPEISMQSEYLRAW